MAAADPNHPDHIPYVRDILIPGYEAKIFALGTLFAAKQGEATACKDELNKIKAQCDAVAEQIHTASNESQKRELTEKLVDLTERKLSFKSGLQYIEEEAKSLFEELGRLAMLKSQAVHHLKYHI